MKFFHLSDLHIGLKLFNRDLQKDQEFVLHQIADYAAGRRPDAIVIAGDLYDKAIPSAEAVDVFDRFVSELTRDGEREVMMISGNHDSAPRINVFRDVLQRQKLHMIGRPPQTPEDRIECVTLQDPWGPVHFYLLPFVRPSMVREGICAQDEASLSYDETLHRLLEREEVNTEERNVLVSHQFYVAAGQEADRVERMDSEICTVGNIDAVRADLLDRFDYAALGHIHKPMAVGKEVFRYCGTPLPCSVSEAMQKKGIIEVEMRSKGDVRTTVLPLTPLHEVRVITGTLAEVLCQGCDDYVTVTLTDREDLDPIDMQERLGTAFPNLLEIRRETPWRADYSGSTQKEAKLNAFDLCCSFLGDANETEKALLRDVIHSTQEGEK